MEINPIINDIILNEMKAILQIKKIMFQYYDKENYEEMLAFMDTTTKQIPHNNEHISYLREIITNAESDATYYTIPLDELHMLLVYLVNYLFKVQNLYPDYSTDTKRITKLISDLNANPDYTIINADTYLNFYNRFNK